MLINRNQILLFAILIAKLSFSQSNSVVEDYFNKSLTLRIENPDLSLAYIDSAIQMISTVDDTALISSVFSLNSIVLSSLNKNDLAIESGIKALELRHKINDHKGVAKSNLNLGNIFYRTGNYRKSIEYYLNSYNEILKLGDSTLSLVVLQNLGSSHVELNQHDSALYYYNLAKDYKTDLIDDTQLADLFYNLGNEYQVLKKFHEAEFFLEQARLMQSKVNDYYGLSMTLNNLGIIEYHKKRYTQAIAKFYEADSLAKLGGNLSEQKSILHNTLLAKAQAYSIDNFTSSLKKYDSISEVLQSEFISNHTIEIETKYQTEKKEQELRFEKERAEKNKQLRETNFATAITLGVALLFSFIGILYYMRYKKQEHQNLTLQASEKESSLGKKISELELKRITAQLEGEQKEQDRISKELHDDLGSLLTILNLQANTDSPQKSENINNLIKACIEKTRSISHDLHNKSNEALSLKNKLQTFSQLLPPNSGVKLELFLDFLPEDLTTQQEEDFLMITLELINNGIKHSDGSNITIQFMEIDNGLVLTYEDDGKGFDSTKKGFGLTNIEKRVQKLNAEISYDSQPQSGTTIIIKSKQND